MLINEAYMLDGYKVKQEMAKHDKPSLPVQQLGLSMSDSDLPELIPIHADLPKLTFTRNPMGHNQYDTGLPDNNEVKELLTQWAKEGIHNHEELKALLAKKG
ncbi:hypothetical protein FRB99_003419, partial [Tulasnella sp. 403]